MLFNGGTMNTSEVAVLCFEILAKYATESELSAAYITDITGDTILEKIFGQRRIARAAKMEMLAEDNKHKKSFILAYSTETQGIGVWYELEALQTDRENGSCLVMLGLMLSQIEPVQCGAH